MILGIILRNYKCYKGLHYIPCYKDNIENLNIIIGDNGVGKSSILEALDSFFNDKEWIVHNDSKGGDVQVGVLLYVEKDKINNILGSKELPILEKISEAFWDVDIKSNSIYERSYTELFQQRDSLINTRETHYLLVIGKKYEAHNYSFISFEKVVDNKLDNLTPKPNQNTLNNLMSSIVGTFSYLYIPVETTVSEFLRLEAAGMLVLADTNLKSAISNALNDKRITRTKENNKRTKKISIIEIINEKLEEYISNIEVDIQKIDPTYDFKPTYRQSSKLTSNHLANVIINAYYAKRTLKKEKKPISTLSSGEKRRALIDIIYVFLAKNKIDRNLILAIDEPESSLHISKCYDQFRKIQAIALECNQQLFITTHWYGSLPILKNGNLIHIQDNQQQSIFNISNCFEDRRNYPDDVNLKSFFDLAASIISAFRNTNCHWLLVEGKEDKQYLNYYLNDINVHIIPLCGCGNVKKIYEYLYTPISNAKSELPDNKGYKILCLVDTDMQAININVASSTTNKQLFIKRWNENHITHDVELMDINHPNHQPTEIEEILDPKLFYTAIKNCINNYGTEEEICAFNAFELDDAVEYSRIRGDNSMLNHLGNGRNIREDKECLIGFIESMKSQIADEYVKLPKTGHRLSWIDKIKQLLNQGPQQA